LGQKVNPIGFRLALNKQWQSRWFAKKQDFGTNLAEDTTIRETIRKAIKDAAITKIGIERFANRVRVIIFSARPGVIVGRKGQDVEKLKAQLAKATKKEIYLDIQEVRSPDADAQLVAESIAQQIEHRIAVKRAIKRAEKTAMDLGVDGIKIRCAGRINGAEIARVEWSKKGKVPLHTLRANIDYGFVEANTTAGKIGVKVWICKREDFQPAARQQRGERGRRNAYASHA
jgi:small subunit ribosomal protein S3